MLTPPLLGFCPARPDPCSSLLLLPAVLPAKREEGALDCEPGDDGPVPRHQLAGGPLLVLERRGPRSDLGRL